VHTKRLPIERVFFLVSDTDDGRATGEILEAYFSTSEWFGNNGATYLVVDDLLPQDPKRFKTKGLRNLVRRMGECISRVGNAADVAIDATGGFKAQIAVAVTMGQALNIPVYYKHELFPEIIDFPALPVQINYDLLGRYAGLLTALEKGELRTASEWDEPVTDEVRLFMNEEAIDGETVLELNYLGQLFLQSYRLRYPYIPALRPATADERKEPTFGNDHHYAKGFKAYVQKVFAENAFIKTIHTVSYEGQAQIKSIGFSVKDVGTEKQLIGTYRSDFGNRFRLRLTDESTGALIWAAEFLSRTYARE
jgi:putative CRISPR-associated protein (TIGR02619 family)